MQAARFEGSLLSSLDELKSIERQRVADERAAVVRAEELRIQELADAQRRRREEVEAKQRAEHEAQLAIEHAKVEAEREARLRVEAAEAAERERQMMALAEARQAQELELRRAEVAKTRPTWMIAVTGLALVLAAVLVVFTVQALSASSEAEQAKVEADLKAKIAQDQAEESKRELAQLEIEIKGIDTRVNAALKRLADANTRAEREKAAEDIKREQAAKREAERKAEEWRKKRDHDKRIEIITIDNCSKNNAICKPGK